jgi:hypothetical protein
MQTCRIVFVVLLSLGGGVLGAQGAQRELDGVGLRSNPPHTNPTPVVLSSPSDWRGAEQSSDVLQPEFRSAGGDTYRIVFAGMEPAIVGLEGDGTTNLDLFVFDQDGTLICKADSPRDSEVCNWFPERTAEFRVEVRNLGSSGNQYRLWTN